MAEVIDAAVGYRNPGEERALAVLRTLPDDWLVIANKNLPLRHGRSVEIDFIVIGPHRVVLLDEKAYRGTFTGSDQAWRLNDGAARPSPLNKIDFTAKEIAGWVRTNVPAFPGIERGTPPLIGGILLSPPTANAQITDPRAIRHPLRLENARDKLLWLDREGADAGLDIGALRPKLKLALHNVDAARRPKRPRSIDLYVIEDQLGERPGCRVFAGRHENGVQRTLYVYENDAADPARRQALDHELTALKNLQETGAAPKIGESFLWSEGEFRVVPVDLPAGAAVGALPAVADEGGAVREVERAAAAFHALARVHQAGVVHRAINPSNVFIDDPAPPKRSDRTVGAPKAMIGGFVAAHVDLTATIAAELDAAGFDDPYAAAEIVRLQSYGYADATSDVYSLALVTLPRLANLNLAAIKRAMADDGALPETSAPWPFLTGSAASQLRAAYNGCLTDGAFANQPRSSAKSMATALDGIARELREDGAWAPGDVLSDQFEIKRLLGEGSSARTYLVLDRVNGRLIAGKQYLRSGDIAPTSPAVREFNLLLDHPHENLPKALGMFDRGVPFFQSRLEYIDGETLRARIPSIRHDRDRWANVARGLLSAGVHLEKHGLLHRDIKPENVMLREADDRVFLIDYGASAHASSAGAPAGSPRYWPPEWRRLDGHPTNCDRYAVAVTLFEALTGVLPFKDAGAAFSSEPLDSPPEGVPARLLPIARLLLTAVSTDPDERPESMRRLRDDLERALAAEDRIIGPDPDPDPPAPAKAVAATEDWIDKLRGVFRNSRRGNSDNRGLDTDFARDTYVRTGLDSLLWPEIQTRRPPVVFLSGNPGDGKTAFLEKVRDRLKRDGAQILGAADPSGWEAETGGHVYRACFDASESVAGLSADEQLANRLRGHDGHDPDRNLTVLVAINDGRLAEVMEAFPARFPWLTGELNRATADGADREQEQNRENRPVWLVDLKQRSYVSLAPAQEASSVMRQMLDSMTSEHRWQGGMPDTRVLAENAAALRRIGPDSPAERLERLLLLAHLRGDRHTTVRDLRSALALIITGDLAPADFASPDPEVLPFAWSGKYWDTIFTTDASRDLVLGEIRWLDPARFAHPKLERFLYFNHRPDDAAKRAALFLDGRDEPPPAGDDPVKLDAWISAVKRRLVLEGAPFAPGVPGSIAPFDLLPYRSADAFVDVLAGRGDGAELLKKILRGIGRSDGISEAMRTGDLVLSVKKSDEFDIEMVKSYPAGDFRLSVPAPRGRHLVETQPRSITLTYAKANARVQLNLDLVEILVRLADGLEPTSQELQPLLEELGPFKSRLQRYSTDRLLVIEGGRRHWIVKDGEKIARQDA